MRILAEFLADFTHSTERGLGLNPEPAKEFRPWAAMNFKADLGILLRAAVEES